jgi:ABC transporter transmembrane region
MVEHKVLALMGGNYPGLFSPENRRTRNHPEESRQVNDALIGGDAPKPTQGIAAEVKLMLHRARQVWRLVPGTHRWALGGAAVVMAVTSVCSTALPLFLGLLVDGVQRGTLHGATRETLFNLAAWYLSLIGAAYLLREFLNVLRRYLVTSACTRINRDMSLQLMGHLMTLPLAALAQEKVGTLHGKIVRSVDGLVRFLRLSFMEFIPALFTGLFGPRQTPRGGEARISQPGRAGEKRSLGAGENGERIHPPLDEIST